LKGKCYRAMRVLPRPRNLIHYTRLAVAHSTVSNGLMPEKRAEMNALTASVDVLAEFQNISSYVNPDIAEVISLRLEHADVLKGFKKELVDAILYHEHDRIDQRIPLLLPLTVGVDYRQRSFLHSQGSRSLCVNIDSLSMMLSTEDIALVQTIVQKWPTQTPQRDGAAQSYAFDVEFESDKLGLGLRKDGRHIVVDHVGTIAAEKYIECGDILHAINGDIISNADVITLAEIVGRLAAECRPLTVTFARPLSSLSDTMPLLQSKADDDEVSKGSVDKLEVLLAAAAMTLMDIDVKLVRCNALSTEVLCTRTRTSTTAYKFDVSSKLAIDYYNLRAWVWEPFLEPGALVLAAEYHNRHRGAREVSIEIGDMAQGPLCINVTNAGVEAFVKFCLPNHQSRNMADFIKHTWLDSITADATHQDTAFSRAVSRKAANAALHFARRQMKESAKPFVIRNRTGLSLAFAEQKATHRSSLHRKKSFVTVGDYDGFEEIDESSIKVVGNGAELKFHVEVLSDDHGGKMVRRFPFLTVALQRVAGLTLEPLRGLDIGRSGDTMVPLRFNRPHVDDDVDYGTLNLCASWNVEQTDERTILTLRGSTQLVSNLQETLEIAVQIERKDNSCKCENYIGTTRGGQSLDLPLWLGFQQLPWRCMARFAGDAAYTTIFRMSEANILELNSNGQIYVECIRRDTESSRFLALSLQNSGGSYVVTIDCAISLRNLLPANLEWTIAAGGPAKTTVIDSSARHPTGLDAAEYFLRSGDRAEIFSHDCNFLHARFRHSEEPSWSTWVSLSLPQLSETKLDLADEVNRHAKILDSFGLPSFLGVRITRKRSGIELVVYAELWLSNCTSLPIVFGFPQVSVQITFVII
jgi:hypothetical protein